MGGQKKKKSNIIIENLYENDKHAGRGGGLTVIGNTITLDSARACLCAMSSICNLLDIHYASHMS